VLLPPLMAGDTSKPNEEIREAVVGSDEVLEIA
jgi:hypothetical protein